MNKFFSMILCVGALFATAFLSSCSSDDDEVLANELTGKWDLIEVQDGPDGMCKEGYANQYPAGSLVIELKANGQIVFNYKDGKVETQSYSFPEDQKQYGSSLPVMNIGEVPFSYAIEGNKLKLHYFGFYLCDHIPATFVFKRTR